jgi:dihydropteroate synthase
MYTLNCKGKLVSLETPLVMGILNLTPDSFYKSDLNAGLDNILNQVEKMIMDGADMIDIGGQSTKPGSIRISAEAELARVLPVVESIVRKFPGTILSIDTFYSDVARKTVEAGISIVNDISAGSIDEKMISTVGSLNVPYICMHIKGTPQTMQHTPEYTNVISEVFDFFISKLNACKEAGIKDIIIDPGFGFGKTTDHNFDLLNHLSVFSSLEKPILVGISRKSMICKSLGIKPHDALNGTTVLNTIALMNGASVLRVHDIKEAKEAVKLFEACKKTPQYYPRR